jgi:hypothetical protein
VQAEELTFLARRYQSMRRNGAGTTKTIGVQTRRRFTERQKGPLLRDSVR